MTIPSLVDVLRLLAGGGAAGVVLSFLLERVPRFQKLKADAKWWLILGVSLLLPVLATAALQFIPAETWKAFEPFWNSIAAGFVVWLSTQAFHDGQERKAARAKRQDVTLTEALWPLTLTMPGDDPMPSTTDAVKRPPSQGAGL